jgi:tetratricopeptide (TPR) repeat protein
MARSLSRPVDQPSGSFVHALSGTRFTVTSNHGLTQKVTRNGLSVEFPVAYVIGSGTHAYGYLVRIGDYLFQSPVSYYSRRKTWDVAPGYEENQNPEFNRPVIPECLQCHSGRPRPVSNTLNRYLDPPFSEEGISCDRCHGDATAHLRRPGRESIVNPARLSPRARDSVCEQCHLSGEARVPNPGHEIGDFHPGQELEEIFSVYVRARQERSQAASIKVISHAEQLGLSTCSLRSGTKLWCGSCHDPHAQPANARQYYRSRCLACHGESLIRTHPKSGKPNTQIGLDDCIGCHMPQRPTKDGAHTAFTDHQIARFPAVVNQTSDSPQNAASLVAWHEPAGALALRNLGLANMTVGEREHSVALMEMGARQLVSAMKSFPDDAAILTKLGLALLRRGESADAVEVYEYALRLEPQRASYHINLAIAYDQAGNSDKAIEQLEQGLALDPSSEIAYQRLGEIYIKKNDTAALRRTLERYLKFMPGNIMTRSTLGRLDKP